MEKYSIDFSTLEKLDRPKAYKLADVKHLIEKVAFDVVRFRENEDTTQLWKIEDSVDGPVIVAMYEIEKIASSKTWEVFSDTSDNINICYKGEAIKQIKASLFGDDVSTMTRYLPKRLAEDKELRVALLNDVSKESREYLYSKYPELRG